jgi:hypothetical protein
MRIGQKGQRIGRGCTGQSHAGLHGLEMPLEGVHATHLGHCHPGQDNNHGHLQHELKQIGDQDTPKPPDKGVEASERNDEKDADR